MTDSIKDYMADQETERVAHIVIRNVEPLLGRKLTEDEMEYTVGVAQTTFKKYTVEHKDNIFVADANSEEVLSDLLDQFTDKLSSLIVHYIYSRLEAYILFKKTKELEG